MQTKKAFEQYLNQEPYVPYRYRAEEVESKASSLNVLEEEVGEGVVEVLEKELF